MGLFLTISITLSVIGIIILSISDVDDLPVQILMGFFILILSSVLSILAMKIVSNFTEPEETTYKIEIANLNNDRLVEGSVGGFIIFNGYIDEESYYFFMAKTKDGGYKEDRVATKNSVIYEVENISAPYVEITMNYQKSTFWYLPLDDEIKQSKFYVPKGTIIKEFKIN